MLTIHPITNMLVLKIQSTSDLITNSSSEVFVIKADGFSFEEVKELIESGAKAHSEAYEKNWENNYKKSWDELEKADMDGYSGMGGELDIMSWKEMYEHRREWDLDYTLEEFAEDENVDVEHLDQYIWIDIDWARRATIQFLYDNFEVVENELS